MTERAAGGPAYEDLVPGWKRTFPPRTVSREDIVRFAREWDPQLFHLDEQAARETHFGGLVASGWHTACLVMRIVVDGLLEDSTSMGSPGLEKLEWLRPVRPGRSAHPHARGAGGAALEEQAGPRQREVRLRPGERGGRDRLHPGGLGHLRAPDPRRDMTATARRSTLTGALPSALLLMLT